LRYGSRPIDVPGAMEYVSMKVGLAMLVLGAMHFALMYTIARYGRRSAGRIAAAGGLDVGPAEPTRDGVPF
ncbi:MAG: hypothetical protein AAGI15_11785, partial [Pseudomonadota bacterium]